MSEKLKTVGVIGDWPLDPEELDSSIQYQQELVSILCDIEEQIPIDELEHFQLRSKRVE